MQFNQSRCAVWCLLLGAFWFASVSAVIAQTKDEVPALKQKAAALLEQQKFVEALPFLEKIAALEPGDSETQFFLGFALMAQGNATKDKSARSALRVRARKAFIKAKELGKTEPIVDGLIQSIPPDGSGGNKFSENDEANDLMVEAESLFTQGKLDEALANYQKAFQLDPKSYEAALFSGDVYLHRNDFAQAEIWYRKAIAVNPNRETAYRYSATPLMKQKKYEAALHRYIEAFICEPYSNFSRNGIVNWGKATNTTLAHPNIEIPVNVTGDDKGNVKVEMQDLKKVSDEDGSFAWMSYWMERALWRNEKFVKTFPQEKKYRHSLAEEVAAIRSVLTVAQESKKIKTLQPSIAKLKKLNDEGLLEAYILLGRPDEGIVEDHEAYLKQHRDKLRRYVLEYVVTGGGK